MAFSTTTYLILIFCAILLSYGTGTAFWIWRRRNDEIAPTLATLLRANGTGVTVVGHVDGPRRYDFWGYELRQAVVQTVDEQRPTLHEVELVSVGEGEDGRTEKAAKVDDAADVDGNGWLSAHTPLAGMLVPTTSRPCVRATFLLAMPSAPAPPFPPPSFNGAAFDAHAAEPGPPEPDDLELATVVLVVDRAAVDALLPIGTPLFRPETHTQWLRTGRRRDQGIYMF